MTPFLSRLNKTPTNSGPSKARPPHLSKGNQSDPSGAVQWGWDARPTRSLFSPAASAVGLPVTKEPRVSQRSVTSPASPWQSSLPEKTLVGASPCSWLLTQRQPHQKRTLQQSSKRLAGAVVTTARVVSLPFTSEGRGGERALNSSSHGWAKGPLPPHLAKEERPLAVGGRKEG